MKDSLKLFSQRIFLFILLLSMVSISDIRVSAAQPDITVRGGVAGYDYTYENHVLVILCSTPMTLSGDPNTDRVYVAPGANAELTRDGLHID